MHSDLFGQLDRVRTLLQSRPFGLVTDIDGTISEIAASPEAAYVPTPLKDLLRTLSRQLDFVAAISGRSASAARGMVGLDELLYVGNHGLEWWSNGKFQLVARARPYLAELAHILSEIERQFNIPGVVFENKRATVSIHYRLATEPESARAAILTAVRQVLASHPFEVSEGKMVIELRPPIGIDKGRALARLVRIRRLKSVVYLGDDNTDVDAFIHLRKLRATGRVAGLAVAVLGRETAERVVEHADATLRGVDDVGKFLDWLVQESLNAGGAGQPEEA